MKYSCNTSILVGIPSLIMSLGMLLSCDQKAGVAVGPSVLARVGTQVITAEDIKNEAARRAAGNQTVPEKADLLQQMVDRLLLVERAKSAKLDADFETRRAIESVLITKLREKELESELAAVEVIDAELRLEFESEPAKFAQPAKVRLALLFQEMKSTMSETKQSEIRQRMEEALQKAQAQPAGGGRGPAAGGFGSLAVDYSEDQVSRYRGGDIGWLEVGSESARWPKEVVEVGCSLEKGKISGIIQAGNGLYVVMKTDFRVAGATSFEEARQGLRQSSMAKKRRQIEEDFIKQTAQLVKSEIDSTALAALDFPHSTKPVVPPNSNTSPPTIPGVPVSVSKSEPK